MWDYAVGIGLVSFQDSVGLEGSSQDTADVKTTPEVILIPSFFVGEASLVAPLEKLPDFVPLLVGEGYRLIML